CAPSGKIPTAPTIARISKPMLRSWPVDAERERAFGDMRIDRQHPPRHAVASRADLAQWHQHDAAADAGLACVDPLPGSVGDRGTAECRLEGFREPQRHLA